MTAKRDEVYAVCRTCHTPLKDVPRCGNGCARELHHAGPCWNEPSITIEPWTWDRLTLEWRVMEYEARLQQYRDGLEREFKEKWKTK
jgi:hypothetical protein